MPDTPDIPSIPSSSYTEDYYLTSCDGYKEYINGIGLPARLAHAIRAVPRIREGHRILDVGCGRGEIVRFFGEQGAWTIGIDYSEAAVRLCRKLLADSKVIPRVAVIRSSAVHLPISKAQFDTVLLLDIVEHLYPAELAGALSEAYRVLKNDGTLVIHTAPNRWYYKFGYPLYRVFRRIQGQALPENPKDRYPYHHALHVNEQSPSDLRLMLKNAGFSCRIWVAQSQDPLHPGDAPWISWMARVVTRSPLLKWFFCGDIYALAKKTALSWQQERALPTLPGSFQPQNKHARLQDLSECRETGKC